MVYYYLEIIRGIETGKKYKLSDGAITIGRGDGNSIQLHENELFVSNHHAILYKYADNISIQDISSKNGIFLNGERITQKDVSLNEVIGLGEKGPLLKIITSNTEFEEENQASREAISQHIDIDRSVIKPLDQHQPTKTSINSDPLPIFKVSKDKPNIQLTAEMECKLKNNQISADDLAKLMQQDARLEKLIQKGNLSDTQTNLLHSAYGAHRKFKRQYFIVISSIIVLFLVIISVFSVRLFHYKSQLNSALELEGQLNSYEHRIIQAKSRGANHKEIAAIVEEFEKTKGQLNIAKSVLNGSDLHRFYQDTIEYFISDILLRFGETDYHIPPQMTERVKHHLETYSNSMKPVVTHFLKRKEVYFPMIHKIFSEKKIPIELSYISMLESGFNPKALSHAGAKGLWQFMPHTARRYGLKIDETVDERIDPQKSTYAAAEYLKDLIGIFGGKSSIMLSIAAYNAGENRIMGALRKIDDPIRNRDFWYIYRMGYLAEETNEYIPRVIALMIIDQNRKQFGFTDHNISATELVESENDITPLNIN